MKQDLKKVISASRRVELPGFYPDRMAEILTARCPPQKTHTLVIWSKHPQPLIVNKKLRLLLKAYDQLFLHLTITGMGGSYLEPGIPGPQTVLSILPDLLDLIRDPLRMRLRIDPIVRLKLPDGSVYTNFDVFQPMLKHCRSMGIRYVVTSWMESYEKVLNRLNKLNIQSGYVTPERRLKESAILKDLAEMQGMHIDACCVSGWRISKCIDGALLTALHPARQHAVTDKAPGQRTLCGCTKSWDVGWYFPCPGGCVYCYANPQIRSDLNGEHPQAVKDALLAYLSSPEAKP